MDDRRERIDLHGAFAFFDGLVVPPPYRQIVRVPTLAGDVEYVCEARRVSRLIARTKTPVFLYSFQYEVDPVIPDRVAHGLDVNFVFGNDFGPPLFASYMLGPTDLALSQAIGGYWTDSPPRAIRT